MIITVYFSEAGAAKTGLSPTIDITDVADGSLDINDGAMTELANGWYKYDFSAADATKQYVYLCDGGAGLVGPERYIEGKIDITLAKINAEVDTALDTALPGSPTADSINDYIGRTKKCVVNKMLITEANGNTVIYEDDDSTPYCSVNAAFTSNATTTSRLKLE